MTTLIGSFDFMRSSEIDCYCVILGILHQNSKCSSNMTFITQYDTSKKKKSTNIRIIVAHSLYARYGVSYFTYVDNPDSNSTKCILLFQFYKLK